MAVSNRANSRYPSHRRRGKRRRQTRLGQRFHRIQTCRDGPDPVYRVVHAAWAQYRRVFYKLLPNHRRDSRIRANHDFAPICTTICFCRHTGHHELMALGQDQRTLVARCLATDILFRRFHHLSNDHAGCREICRYVHDDERLRVVWLHSVLGVNYTAPAISEAGGCVCCRQRRL